MVPAGFIRSGKERQASVRPRWELANVSRRRVVQQWQSCRTRRADHVGVDACPLTPQPFRELMRPHARLLQCRSASKRHSISFVLPERFLANVIVVRLMFAGYLVVIATVLAVYIAIGLLHR
jgi:hypothetical protein